VRSKLRLHILDGLLGQADGGPGFRTWNDMFVHEKMLFSVDPVAMDTIGRDWLAAARKEKGLPPLEEAENRVPGETKGRPPKHIDTAAARGLGTNDRERIEITQLTVPAQEEEE